MQNKFQTAVITVLVVVLTVAVYYVGVGAGANRKEAEMKASRAFGQTADLENLKSRMAVLEPKVEILEATDASHEQALTGAATRLHQLGQVHDNLARQSAQTQGITRNMLGLMERSIQCYVGDDKWKKYVGEARLEIEKEQKERAAKQAEQMKAAAKAKAREDAIVKAAVDKALAEREAKALAKEKKELEAKGFKFDETKVEEAESK